MVLQKRIILAVCIPVVLIAVGVWVYFGFFSEGHVVRVEDMAELVGSLDKLHGEINERETRISEAIKAFNATRPEGQRIDVSTSERLQLKEVQKQILEKMLKGEEDVSYQGLLDKVGKQAEEIDQLGKQIAEIESRLPAPYEVKEKRETHYGISLKYLTEEKGLSKEKARELLDKIALVENLVPGFQVWLMYDEKADVFGSFVTQGTAKVSPRYLQKRAKQTLLRRIASAEKKEKERFEQLEEKKEEASRLQSGMDSLRSVQESLGREREEAVQRAREEERQRKRAEQELNTVYYAANTVDSFKRQGVLKDPRFRGPRMESFSRVAFDGAIDLREAETIEIGKTSGAIKEVFVFPGYLRQGQHYSIEYNTDRSLCTLRILDKDAFLRAKQVVLAYE